MRWLATLMVALGLHSQAAAARTLEVEVDFQYVRGMVEPAEFDGWLASPELVIQALYVPLKLIEGKTARRIKTMPFGTRLEPNTHTIVLRGAQVLRAGRTLRFRLDEQPPTEEPYRLASVAMSVPIRPGIGRPEPVLRIGLVDEPVPTGAHQAAFSGDFEAFALGARVRYRWSDAPPDWKREEPMCGGDAQQLDAEHYRFRPRHRHAGLFRALNAAVSSDPPEPPPPGWKSFRMREPYPAPIEGWRLSRSHLVRLDVPGGRIDRLSVYAKQAGAGECVRTRSYDALFSGEQLVRFERSADEYNCGNGNPPSRIAQAEWREDGVLATYLEGSGAAPGVYDAFSIGQPAACGAQAPAPAAAEANDLKAEASRLRRGFLAN